MKTMEDTRVVVQVGPAECHAVTTTRVHHRDFPELHAEGESAAEAATHLKNLLARAVDSAASSYRREAFVVAIADVDDFIAGHH